MAEYNIDTLGNNIRVTGTMVGDELVQTFEYIQPPPDPMASAAAQPAPESEVQQPGSSAEHAHRVGAAPLDTEAQYISINTAFFSLSKAIKNECRNYLLLSMYKKIHDEVSQAEVWFTDGNHWPAWKIVMKNLCVFIGREDLADVIHKFNK